MTSPRLFAYGIAAEYCLACGLFEEAAVWDKKYKDALTAAYRSPAVAGDPFEAVGVMGIFYEKAFPVAKTALKRASFEGLLKRERK